MQKLHRHITNAIEWYYMDNKGDISIFDLIKEIATYRPVAEVDRYINQASRVVAEISSYIARNGIEETHQLLDDYLKENE